MMLRLVISLLSTLLLSACSQHLESVLAPLQQLAPVTQASYSYKAVGYASIKLQKGENFEQKMLNASKVSKIDAYEELAAHLHGVFVQSQAEVKGYQLSQDEIFARTQGLVKEARVVKAFHQGDIFITVLQLRVNSSDLTQNNLHQPSQSRSSQQVKGNQVYY